MGRSFRVRVALLAAATVLVSAVPATASSTANDDSVRLRRAVTVTGILQHEVALQLSATFDGGNRLSGTPG
jgi:hypothetical protein